MKNTIFVLIGLFASVPAQASIADFPGTHDYVGSVFKRFGHREIRTVVSKIPPSHDNAFDRAYDVYLVNTKTGTEELIATDVTGDEIQDDVKKLVCPIAGGPWDCGNERILPVTDDVLSSFGGLLLVVPAFAFDVGTLPLRAPFLVLHRAKATKMSHILKAMINTDWDLNNPPRYEVKFESGVNILRFTRLLHMMRKHGVKRESP